MNNQRLFMRTALFSISLLLTIKVAAQAENLILISIDGMRWQEVFRGPDPDLVANPQWTSQAERIGQQFRLEQGDESASALMPFLHSVVAKQGFLLGNRDQGSCASVSNPWYFSYPGYNEILTGKADPDINTNDPIPNPNITFLEWLNHQQPNFKSRIAAFGSWNVFSAIINEARSGVPVNAGKDDNDTSVKGIALAKLHDEVPQLWDTVRLDLLTQLSALQYLDSAAPRVLYIAYGETDDFAHDGHYDQYLFSAHRTDRFIQDIWDYVQSHEQYRDKTALLITTDHGRGEIPAESWQHHASKLAVESYMPNLDSYPEGIVGSNAVWIAGMGPGIKHSSDIKLPPACVTSSQIAASALQLLGIDYKQFNPAAGAPINEVLDTNARN